MFLIIVIAIIVLVILWKKGVFRKPGECKCCGKALKGTEQQVFSYGDFCLCKECADKIHPQIIKYAKENWNYTDYTDYLTWEDATKEERAQFNPDVTYGYQNSLTDNRKQEEIDHDDVIQILADCGVPFAPDGTPLGIGWDD